MIQKKELTKGEGRATSVARALYIVTLRRAKLLALSSSNKKRAADGDGEQTKL